VSRPDDHYRVGRGAGVSAPRDRCASREAALRPSGWRWPGVVSTGLVRNAAEMDEKTLSFEQVRRWLLAKVSHPVSVQVVVAREIVAFLEGRIDRVIGFESTESHGVLIEGAAGAWTLEPAEPEFVSAVLTRVPDSFALDQLMIRTRDHLLVIDRGCDVQPAD
jgi:hypothetical protein